MLLLVIPRTILVLGRYGQRLQRTRARVARVAIWLVRVLRIVTVVVAAVRVVHGKRAVVGCSRHSWVFRKRREVLQRLQLK
jgi:hypothetical protein